MKKTKLILIFLLSSLLCTSVVMVFKEISTQQKEKKEFNNLLEIVVPIEKSSTDQETSPPPETENVTETTESPPKRNLAQIFEMNSECVGWICIDDTSINYPIMHTPDNPQKYLRKNFEGKYSQSGVPFLDARCNPKVGTLIIYGHNMKNGTQFSNLKKYLDAEFRSSHSTIEFETKDGIRYYSVVDVIQTDIYDEIYNQINTEDDTLILSTCYGSAKSGRLLIIAKEATA